MSMINIAAYRFISLADHDLNALRATLKQATAERKIKGTILLSEEGINLFVAGEPHDIASLKTYLNGFPAFKDLPYKESPSSDRPFKRMLVKIKKEIIALGQPQVKPGEHTAPHLEPQALKQWYDEGKDMLVFDTRNTYEYDLGTFKDAINPHIDKFRDFDKAVANLPEEAKEKPVVTFCTGGIRCEKAAEYMLQQGFKEVYQLHGGILNYFEQCGSEHYNGECFVFDKRVGVAPDLSETDTIQCFACRMPLMAHQQTEPPCCPHCGKNPTIGKRQQIGEEAQQPKAS